LYCDAVPASTPCREAAAIVTEIVEIGLRYAPEETHEALVRDVMAFGERF
jgi:hypothetical protein